MGIPFIDTARITKLLLFFIGIVLVISGFVGLLYDYFQNLALNYAEATVPMLLVGVGVLVITTIVYVVMPGSYRQRRVTALREMYGERSDGVEKSMLHHVRETSQALINSIEIVELCCENSLTGPREVRMENIRNAKARLPLMVTRYRELQHIIDEFDAYTESRDGERA